MGSFLLFSGCQIEHLFRTFSSPGFGAKVLNLAPAGLSGLSWTWSTWRVLQIVGLGGPTLPCGYCVVPVRTVFHPVEVGVRTPQTPPRTPSGRTLQVGNRNLRFSGPHSGPPEPRISDTWRMDRSPGLGYLTLTQVDQSSLTHPDRAIGSGSVWVRSSDASDFEGSPSSFVHTGLDR